MHNHAWTVLLVCVWLVLFTEGSVFGAIREHTSNSGDSSGVYILVLTRSLRNISLLVSATAITSEAEYGHALLTALGRADICNLTIMQW